MAISTAINKSIDVQYMESNSLFRERDPGCLLASLMSQSLSMHVELEKIHWHLRLSHGSHAVSLESVSPVEVAREVSAISLQLVSSISRLQRVLDLKVSSECAALFAAVEEKIAEIFELASDQPFDLSQHAKTRMFQGLGRAEHTFSDTRLPESERTF
jgi:hypothetical protein